MSSCSESMLDLIPSPDTPGHESPQGSRSAEDVEMMLTPTDDDSSASIDMSFSSAKNRDARMKANSVGRANAAGPWKRGSDATAADAPRDRTVPVASVNPGFVSPSADQLNASFGYVLARGNGIFTPLIPADTVDGTIDGIAKSLSQSQIGGMIVLPAPLLAYPRPDEAVSMVSQRLVDRLARTSGVRPDVVTTDDPIQDQINAITAQTYDPFRIATSTMKASPATSTPYGPGPGPRPSFVAPRKEKIYCDKWVHDGTCAFVQIGCKYLHKMPTDKETQLSLGLNNGFPPWYRRQNNIALAGSSSSSSSTAGGHRLPAGPLLIDWRADNHGHAAPAAASAPAPALHPRARGHGHVYSPASVNLQEQIPNHNQATQVRFADRGRDGGQYTRDTLSYGPIARPAPPFPQPDSRGPFSVGAQGGLHAYHPQGNAGLPSGPPAAGYRGNALALARGGESGEGLFRGRGRL